LLAEEIGYWLQGQTELNKKNYEMAETSLTQALELNIKKRFVP